MVDVVLHRLLLGDVAVDSPQSVRSGVLGAAERTPSHSGGNSTRNGAPMATAISAMAAQPWRRKRIQAAAATVMLVAMTSV
jgi:hypothetical protein